MNCTASGGTVVSSSLTGPGGVDLVLQPVGSIGRTGQNTYFVTSGTLSGRNNGDTYQCTAAANLYSPDLNDSTVLRGIYMHIMCICIRAQSEKYYIVDGETIHYCLCFPLSPLHFFHSLQLHLIPPLCRYR